ncbi:putative late blight resistance protein homolog r1a-6 [Phtheirospermum japonicum]|uniref:Putative late blight resistance protein homolog r1a-6 n=1 Tax=Phtheirospermum japonicum TaxID=374723 RepID=A0A830DH45_9LAMI|nr:putative late blight resistance protein homolog r1a-6 [Phtheirospermum japonicum]
MIQDFELIKRDVMQVIGETGIQRQINYSVLAGRSGSTPITVGLDDVLIEAMDKLTGQQSNRKIIPIVGMGGIGKTTLARNIYVNPLIVHHFDFCGWATISQKYNTLEILLEIFLCLKTNGSREGLSQKSEHELGEILYKSLSGRRYLVVMDDIWSIEAWDTVKCFFPDDSNGSRIIITTRVSNLASELSGSYVLKMNFLDEDESCPLELEDIGIKIAKSCKGLPLSIVVIGGLLTKSEQTREHWQYISENLNSIVNLEDNEYCLKLLRLSYNQLPVHLKPCFLYLGIFPEDYKIRVSTLINLWVAEGFLKPISGKSLEVAAGEYLKDLIDRSLILVDMLGSAGNIKLCTIHDLLRDLCIKVSENDNFFGVADIHSLNIPQGMHAQRRIGIHHNKWRHNIVSTPLARSLICSIDRVIRPKSFRLLRILNRVETFKKEIYGAYLSLEDYFQLVNSRYLHLAVDGYSNSRFRSSVCLLWNLQTLDVQNLDDDVTAPSEIWKMVQLRHVRFSQLELPDPPSGVRVMRRRTLSRVRNFKCSDAVVKRIPNIKKLKIYYEGIENLSPYCLNNICRLDKLKSLDCSFFSWPSRSYLVQNLSFPHSLNKLTLQGTNLHWDDMATKIGLLPRLQVLKLKRSSFVGPEWETFEEQFCGLKFLEIDECNDLEYWRTASTHFPCLERLVLWSLDKFKEIPLEIGDIATMRSIELEGCNDSAMISAKQIVKEQEDLGNEGLQVRVRLSRENQQMKSFASRNFIVEFGY